jgi:hypothetical protein
MYYTRINTFTREEVCFVKGLRDRKTQRALMQFAGPPRFLKRWNRTTAPLR